MQLKTIAIAMALIAVRSSGKSICHEEYFIGGIFLVATLTKVTELKFFVGLSLIC